MHSRSHTISAISDNYCASSHFELRGSSLARFVNVLILTFCCLSGAGRTSQAEEPKAEAVPGRGSASLISSMDVLNASHKVGPGDRISFRVIEDEDPSVPLSVMDSGEMEVPHIGRVMANGKTCKTLAYEIKKELEKEYYYQATVILGLDVIGSRVTSRGKVYVMGQVRSQGGVEIPTDEVFTVSKALLRAGGFAEYADRRKVKLVRKVGPNGAAESKIVDLKKVMEEGKPAGDVVVEPEDVIIVPEKLLNF